MCVCFLGYGFFLAFPSTSRRLPMSFKKYLFIWEGRVKTEIKGETDLPSTASWPGLVQATARSQELQLHCSCRGRGPTDWGCLLMVFPDY